MPRRLLPTTETPTARTLHAGSNPRSESLVPRTRHLPSHKRTHTQSLSHTSHRLRSLRRGVGVPRGCTAQRRHPCPTSIYSPLGTHRRQPRVGGGMGRRPLVVPRSLRAGTHTEYGMVQRERLARDADAHPCLRQLRRSRRSRQPAIRTHRNQCHRKLRPLSSAHRRSPRQPQPPCARRHRGVQSL